MTLPATAFKVFAPDLICSRDSVSGDLRIEGIASSTVRDHHGDAISQKALQKMADSALRMTIFMNHEYRVPQDVFGTVEKSKVIKTGEVDPRTKSEIWDLRFGIVVAKTNPEAIKTFELIEQDKVHLGLSIGAMLPDGGYTKDDSDGGRFLIDDIDIIETSMVGIPASPRSFVDYAFKAITGVYPESKSRESALKKFTAKYITGIEGVDLEKNEDETLEAPAGLEAVPATIEKKTEPEGNVIEGGVTIDGVGIEESDKDAAAETAAAEADRDDGETDDGTAGEKVEASIDPEHLKEGEPFEQVETPHVDIVAGKSGQHAHPHAHAHDHEHEHGYAETRTVHSHAHGHQHSHDHGSDHDHDDTSNDYVHSHPHNGSYDEDHAHETKGAKKSLEPDASKASVTVWENADGSKVTEVNTGRQRAKADEDQSVQASIEPDTTGGPAGAEADKTASTTTEGDTEIVSALAEIVSKQGSNMGVLLTKVVAQNTALRAKVTQLTEERETVLKVAKTAIDSAGALITQFGKLPAGRKTLDSHPHIEQGFDDVAHIYNADVRKLMKGS